MIGEERRMIEARYGRHIFARPLAWLENSALVWLREGQRARNHENGMRRLERGRAIMEASRSQQGKTRGGLCPPRPTHRPRARGTSNPLRDTAAKKAHLKMMKDRRMQILAENQVKLMENQALIMQSMLALSKANRRHQRGPIRARGARDLPQARARQRLIEDGVFAIDPH
jgi:hypothetical protein